MKILHLQVHAPWQSRSSNFFSSPAYYIGTWTIVSLRSRMAERTQQNSHVWQMWQGYYLCVLSWPSLNIMFLVLLLLLKHTYLNNGEIWRKVCWNQITITFVTQGLPSSFHSHRVALVHRYLNDSLQRTCSLLTCTPDGISPKLLT